MPWITAAYIQGGQVSGAARISSAAAHDERYVEAMKATPRARKKPADDKPFERVWTIVKRVPRGRVVTYGQLSQLIDGRLTPVGVGWAIRAAAEGSIPWQRVVNSRGGISTDRENSGLQRALLEAEGIDFDEDGRIDLAAAGWKPRRQ
jgi:methylated-DNA-protein-cysteine methyltransferase related protein